MIRSNANSLSNSIVVARSLLRRNGVVRTADLVAFDEISRSHAVHVLAHLAEGGEAVRLGQGVYQATCHGGRSVGRHPLVGIAALLAEQPYYVSWYYALGLHGLTDQMPRVIAVAAGSKHRARTIAGYDIEFARLSADRLAAPGIDVREFAGVPVSIASPGRTVLDCLNRPDLGGGLISVVRALADPSLDLAQIVALAPRVLSTADIRRLGYLLEQLDLGIWELLEAHVGSGPYVMLDAHRGGGRETSRRWHIHDTLGAKLLRRWRDRET